MSNLRALSALCALALAAQTVSILPAQALAGKSKEKDKPKPAGTLLLPLTPRIDDGTAPPLYKPMPQARSAQAVSTPPSSGHAATSASASAGTSSSASSKSASKPRAIAARPPAAAAASDNKAGMLTPKADPSAESGRTAASDSSESDAAANAAPAAQGNISAEQGNEDDGIDENTLLKGTVQIVADDTEYDQEKNTFLGTGNAVAIIAGQNSRLEADTILYDQNNQTIDARGNVKILRQGQLTTGSSFKFKVESDEYLVTDPDTELQGTQVVARIAKGNKEGLMFRKGTFTLPEPVHLMNNGYYGPLSSTERVAEEKAHPDAYVPQKQSFKFTARKMIYEKYKDSGNLTVFGGRLKFDNFTVPLPHFTANVGTENSRVVFPVTPLIGNNMMVGGINLGPQFNYAVGKTGAFSWAPLVQIGGRQTLSSGISDNAGKIGAGFKIGYTDDRLSTHIAYGSVSNMLVGDLKYRLNKHTMFQSGINRFLNDGLFGMRRARLLAEVVDQRGISGIPYISYLSFRTSAGWAQDNPSLVALSGSQYSQLFKQTHTGKVSAYRLQEQVMASTHPIFALGDQKYGADMTFFGGVAARAYSTGDHLLMGQVGPMLSFRADRLRARIGYTQAGVSGQSPFVFDQFIQGSKSTFMQGDVKVCKWLTLGTNLGYNLDSKMLYQRSITAAIGPEDFKLLFTRDTISGYQRFGFDVLMGQPVPFDKLVLKGRADAGQLGGI